MQLTTNGDLFFAMFTISGTKKQSVDAMVDTGATETLVNEEIINKAGLTFNGVRDKLVASGIRTPFTAWLGRIEMDTYSKNDALIFGLPPVKLGGKTLEGLLGRDVMRNFQLSMDWKNKSGELKPN